MGSSSGDKYSMDFIIIFGFLIGLFLIAFDIVFSFGVNIPILNSIQSSICNSFELLCRNKINIKILSLLVFALCSIGLHVKKIPKTSKYKYYALGSIFLMLFINLISPLFIQFPLFYLLVSVLSSVLFIAAILIFRRYFSYFDKDDQFNENNEIFKQEKKKMTNEHSVNLRMKNGWINVINPFRGCIVMGNPGSGKTYSIIEEFIRQQMLKKFSFMIYDFKFPSLTQEAYNFYKASNNKASFKIVNLEDIEYSQFINPIAPDLIQRTSDAIEASQTVLFNLNKEWIEKKDFFAQSAISYFSACIYFLKLYQNGKFCTLPHAISLASQDDKKVFKLLETEPELEFFLTPFKDALEKQAYEQLAGQTASARIPLSQIATKELFWVMGNNVYPEMNVDLNINLVDQESILVLANNPKTQKTNAPALGLIVTQLMKLINVQKRSPSSLVLDELPTLYFMGLDNLMATARSNKVCTLLGFQDLEQLKRDYGEKAAQTIFNIAGNIFSGSVKSNTAKELQEIFGKTKQKIKNVSVQTDVTSVSINEQLEYILPQSRISQLSQGEFVGVLSDNFDQGLKRKIFRGFIIPDKGRKNIKGEELIKNSELPEDLESYINLNFKRIIEEVNIIIENELATLEEKEQNKPS
ncbi:type IV secretion system DNA-binding domain-containing protein [Galbibacter sp. EGI 63066]|uniref:TraM recognition domain-containing protein n=1 Tax=Galbibacter sp. EGI 63066 TaxID=2993559 RepID=UPI00224944CA|nr:TraM recognition domain-containing protein [Galbibacter sp. EGI 63066]MCX2681916.1 type IV secretion system DNA-binding domain-containing protein [Galbibacter sp. EGI 63066]